MDERAEDPRDPEAIVNAFLQHGSMKQMQDYLARGRIGAFMRENDRPLQ
jgi:hypothetical protein